MDIFPLNGYIPKLSKIVDNDSFFGEMKHNFSLRIKQGLFREIQRPAFFLYRIIDDQNTITGILCGTHISNLYGDLVPHEKTIQVKTDKLVAYTKKRKAFIKPVLTGFRSNQTWYLMIEKFSETVPLISFQLGQEEHEIYPIPKMHEEKVQDYFKKIPRAYIADGHHRCSAFTRLYQSGNYKVPHLYSFYVPFRELKLFAFDRILHFKNEEDLENGLIHIQTKLNFKPYGKLPEEKHNMGIMYRKQIRTATWKTAILEDHPHPFLDTYLFQKEVVEPLLKMLKLKIEYISSKAPLVESNLEENHSNLAIRFLLYPINYHDLMAWTDQGKTLPAKSTWFEPRMLNGVIAVPLQ